MWFIKTKECLYHFIIMHMLNMISKKIKVSSRDVIMEETHMKEKGETNNDALVYKAPNLTGYLPKSSFIKIISGARIVYKHHTLGVSVTNVHHISIQPNIKV